MAVFTTKYNIGDKVYIIWRNHLTQIKIGAIKISSGGFIYKNTEVFYIPDWTFSPVFACVNYFNRQFKEQDIFDNLDEAIKNIKA